MILIAQNYVTGLPNTGWKEKETFISVSKIYLFTKCKEKNERSSKKYNKIQKLLNRSLLEIISIKKNPL